MREAPVGSSPRTRAVTAAAPVVERPRTPELPAIRTVPHNVAVPIPSEALPAQLAAQHPAGSVPGVVDDSTTGKNPWSSSRTRNLLFSLARTLKIFWSHCVVAWCIVQFVYSLTVSAVTFRVRRIVGKGLGSG